MVPWLTSQFAETRRLAKELRALREQAARRERASLGGGGTTMVVSSAADAHRIAELERAINAKLEEAIGLGMEVRRVDGLVDFPTWKEGQPAFLCWKFGEKRVGFWHPSGDGFGGRRQLNPPTSNDTDIN